jgi:hypothetical protein
MRGLSVLALGALVAALALPAEAASPPKKEIARLKRRLTRSSAGGAVFRDDSQSMAADSTDLPRRYEPTFPLATAMTAFRPQA